jgi:hypothetical protein
MRVRTPIRTQINFIAGPSQFSGPINKSTKGFAAARRRDEKGRPGGNLSLAFIDNQQAWKTPLSYGGLRVRRPLDPNWAGRILTRGAFDAALEQPRLGSCVAILRYYGS